MYISVPHSLCQSYSLLKWSWHFRPKRHMMYEVQTTASNTNNKKNISVIMVALIVSGLSTFQLFWLLSSCRACPHFSYYGGSHFVKRVQISSKNFGFVCSSNLFTQFANLYIQAFRNTYENSLLWISEQINEFKVTRQS